MSLRKSVVYAAAICFALAGAVDAQARAGGGGSFGSRGGKSFSTVPSTRTAPGVSPFSPSPGMANQGLLRPNPGSRGMFGGFGRGLLGGLIGAGLIGMLFGHGLFGGLGGLMSILGLILQIGLIVLLVRFAIGFFRSRQTYASAGPAPDPNAAYRAQDGFRRPDAMAGGMGAGAATFAPMAIEKPDYDAFERLLGAVQKAYSSEDAAALSRLTTPQMASHFASELAENRARGVVNRIDDVRLVQGDLAESWREAGAEYASVAMRFSLIDATLDRASGRVVAGDANRAQEATEVWTFARAPGSGPDGWRLSAIQQGR